MQIIDADPTRMIDLPGVGHCPRPVDIDQSVTGFDGLKSLRIYRFAPGATIAGESEGDEVFVLPLSGAFDIAIDGAHSLQERLSPEGPVRALYMTPHHAYRLTPDTETLVAYARADAIGTVPVCAVRGVDSNGLAEHLHFHLVTLPAGAGYAPHVGGEKLVHVMSGAATVAGRALAAGQTVALDHGEAPQIDAVARCEFLVVSV